MMQAAKLTISPRSNTEGGFQFKGLILILICGFYGILLLLVAALFNQMVKSIKSTAKSIVWKVEVTESTTVLDAIDDNNNDHRRIKSPLPRALCNSG